MPKAPLLFLHGVGGGHHAWERQVPFFGSRGWPSHAWDQPGYGKSALVEPYDLEQVSASLARLVGALGGEPVVLVGHSFGTFICLAYAARHPRRVAGLVLLDPPSEWIGMDARRERLLAGAVALSHVGAFLAAIGVVRLCLDLLTGGAPGAPRTFVKLFGPSVSATLERLVGEVRKDRKSTRLNSSHMSESRMPSSA